MHPLAATSLPAAPIYAAIIVGALALVTQALVKVWDARQDTATRKNDALSAYMGTLSALGQTMLQLRKLTPRFKEFEAEFVQVRSLPLGVERTDRNNKAKFGLKSATANLDLLNAELQVQKASLHASHAAVLTLMDAMSIARLPKPSTTDDPNFDAAVLNAQLQAFLNEARSEIQATRSVGARALSRRQALSKFRKHDLSIPR